jgi:hypothetical protein
MQPFVLCRELKAKVDNFLSIHITLSVTIPYQPLYTKHIPRKWLALYPNFMFPFRKYHRHHIVKRRHRSIRRHGQIALSYTFAMQICHVVSTVFIFVLLSREYAILRL